MCLQESMKQLLWRTGCGQGNQQGKQAASGKKGETGKLAGASIKQQVKCEQWKMTLFSYF
jgi:hypothetical protein